MNEIMAALSRVPTALSTFSIAVLAMVVGELVYLVANPKRCGPEGYRMALRKNPALCVALGSFLGALGIALNCGVSITDGTQWSVATIAIGSVLAILLLLISTIINDKLVLYGIDNAIEINKGNLAMAVAEGGGILATGFILRGVFMSDSASLADKLVDIGFYWLVGQVLLVIGAWVFRHLMGCELTGEIAAGNLAPALLFGGFMIAYGMIVEASLTGATSNLFGELPTILIFSLIGFVLLIAIHQFLARVLFAVQPAESQSAKVGPSVLQAAVLIGLSFVFSGTVDSSITKPVVPPVEADANN